MREIKFRAWDKKNKIMRSVNDREIYDDLDRNGYSCVDSVLNDETSIVMQWTGLVDKNGVDIYEGDIVRTRLGNFENIGKIFFEHSCFMIEIGYTILQNGLTKFPLITNDYQLEVVGNIFENPEL